MKKPNEVDPKKFRESLNRLLTRNQIKGYEIAEVIVRPKPPVEALTTSNDTVCWRLVNGTWVPYNC